MRSGVVLLVALSSRDESIKRVWKNELNMCTLCRVSSGNTLYSWYLWQERGREGGREGGRESPSNFPAIRYILVA